MWRFTILFLFLLLMSCHSTTDLVAAKEQFAPASIFQLMAPRLVVDSVLFRKNAKVELAMDFPEAEIRYTLDGSPVTRNSNLYNNALTISETTVLQVVVYHPDCQASEPLVQPFYKISSVFEQAKMTIEPSPEKRYAANGVASLTDLQKGSAQFRNGKKWLGFQKDTVTIQMEFAEKTTLESIVVSTLADELAWIFLPRRIELLENEVLFSSVDKEILERSSETGLHFITIDFPKQEFKNMTIRILNDPLPPGHSGAGSMAWFFVDEIIAAE